MELQDVLHYESLLHDFWRGWFGCGREVFQDEARVFIGSSSQFLEYIKDCKRKHTPCWCSVQPFLNRNQLNVVEKLFFDFDGEKIIDAWREVSKFANVVRQSYGAEPLILYSGRKGYHCHVFFAEPVKLGSFEELKTFYVTAQKLVLKGLEFKTLDMQVVGDVKRLSRVPYTVHEKTGNPCTPITAAHTPCLILDLTPFRTNGLPASFTRLCLKKLEEKRVHLKVFRNEGNPRIRPCIQTALDKPLDGRSGHLMRLAVACEYLNNGYTVDEVVSLFQSQLDFSLEKTRYYVEHAKKNHAKPFKCATIRELGFCLEGCEWRHKL